MKIQCKLIRKDGTTVSFDDDDGTVEYHFAPQADGKHVAEVADEEHAKKLLKITSAYAPADEESIVLADTVVEVALESHFVDPVSKSVVTAESLEEMAYPEVKRYGTEKYGLNLNAKAKKADWIVAILNAQGL